MSLRVVSEDSIELCSRIVGQGFSKRVTPGPPGNTKCVNQKGASSHPNRIGSPVETLFGMFSVF